MHLQGATVVVLEPSAEVPGPGATTAIPETLAEVPGLAAAAPEPNPTAVLMILKTLERSLLCL